MLRRQELDESLAFTWRHHGAHEPPDVFASRIWADSLFQFAVSLDPHSNTIDGLVSAYQPDATNGTVYFAAARFKNTHALRFVGSIGLSLDYLFFGWPFRKVYFESPSFCADNFRSGIGEVLQEEGRLKDHVFLGDRYWDLEILSLWRDDWAQHRAKYVRFA